VWGEEDAQNAAVIITENSAAEKTTTRFKLENLK
jgi:hypothetical protein